MSSASSISQIQHFALSLLNTDQAMMELNPLWQYSISQTLALMSMILSAWMFGRGAKRIRRK
jgi:lipopolysaccharide export LptBFGC system permease protein LptF